MKPQAPLPLLAVCVALAAPAFAQTLLLDFGPTAATGASLTNSPYHTETGASSNTWNTLATSAVTSSNNTISSLAYANNTAATGVSLTLGSVSVSGSTYNLNFTSPTLTSSALGSQVNVGVYADSSVGKDGIFVTGSTNTQNVGAAISVTGLAAGTYDIFVTGLNSNTTSSTVSRQQAAFAAVSASLPTSLTGISSELFTNGGLVNDLTPTGWTSAWVEGVNYAKISVSVSALTDRVTIFTLGSLISPATTDARGFLNSVMIAPIPEPSAFAALAGLGALGLAALRRRR